MSQDYDKNGNEDPKTTATTMPVALVTGSSSGIGEAIVKRFAKLGYRVVITGRSQEDIERVAYECQQNSPSNIKPLEVQADLEQLDQVEQLLKRTVEHYGQLDVLVNNAAFAWPHDHSDIEGYFCSFQRTMAVNVTAPVRLTLLAAEWLKASHGSIVNVSSIASIQPGQIGASYSTSKAALNMFSKAMAVELAPNVRVNYICPGPVETKIIQRSGLSLQSFRDMAARNCLTGRIGQPDEIARAVTFLASNESASFITGSELIIDGGLLNKPLYWDIS